MASRAAGARLDVGSASAKPGVGASGIDQKVVFRMGKKRYIASEVVNSQLVAGLPTPTVAT